MRQANCVTLRRVYTERSRWADSSGERIGYSATGPPRRRVEKPLCCRVHYAGSDGCCDLRNAAARVNTGEPLPNMADAPKCASAGTQGRRRDCDGARRPAHEPRGCHSCYDELANHANRVRLPRARRVLQQMVVARIVLPHVRGGLTDGGPLMDCRNSTRFGWFGASPT